MSFNVTEKNWCTSTNMTDDASEVAVEKTLPYMVSAFNAYFF